jgi:hypothetical protein
MWKALIVSMFSLSCCWCVSHFINLGRTVFMAAGVPISGGVLLFCVASGLVYGRVK